MGYSSMDLPESLFGLRDVLLESPPLIIESGPL